MAPFLLWLEVQQELEPRLELLLLELVMQQGLEPVRELLLSELNVRMEPVLQQELELLLELLPL